MLSAQRTVSQSTEFIIGYRTDVRPFSDIAKPNPEGRLTEEIATEATDAVITGCIMNICTSVLENMPERADFTPVFKAVPSAVDRFDWLQNGKIHVLCDPATIDRIKLSFDSVMVSPPVYLTGIGVAEYTGDQWAYHWPCIGPVVCMIKGRTAPRAVEKIAVLGDFGASFSRVVDAHPYDEKVTLSDDDKQDVRNCKALATANKISLQRLKPEFIQDDLDSNFSAPTVVYGFTDHESLAKALCGGEIYYSVGDLEIISSALQSVRETSEPDCKARVNPNVLTEELYAVSVRVTKAMTTADKLALSFLRQMPIEIHKGQDSILVRSFVDNFDREKISRSLDLFFWSLVAGTK